MTLPLLAVSLFVMLAFAALAIDLASLRDAKSEAQRDADAIALAGASAFRDFPSTNNNTIDSARTRAIAVARKNKVRADTLDVRNPVVTTNAYGWGKVYVVETNQVTLNIIPDSQRVRAWVRHAGVANFFGHLLARPYGHVQAMATAWATNAGPVVNCLKPFVIPDIWHEGDKTNQDINNNDYMEPSISGQGNTQTGESWMYQPASIGGSDYYLPYDPSVPNDPSHPQTGYGSSARDANGYTNDVGLPLLIKPQTGNGNGNAKAERMGNSFWLLDLNPNMKVDEEIASGCGTGTVGSPVPYEQGGKTGLVKNGIDALVKQDPDAKWNQSTKQVEGSNRSDWTKSPRVVIIGLISPDFWKANQQVTNTNYKPDPNSVFNNFARVFIQDADGNDNIQAIFLGPAPGGGGGSTSGTLVKKLQLIQ